MRCSRLFLLVLTICNIELTQSFRRSLNNIFNRTNTTQRDDATSSISNATSKAAFDQHIEVHDSEGKSWYKASDIILPQRRRRLGVGTKNKRPSDDFIEGNENMHRFFDKMAMSMTTEVSFVNILSYAENISK